MLVKVNKVLGHLKVIVRLEKTILMTEQEALAAIRAVSKRTTENGIALGKEGDTLQLISDRIDAIIARGEVPASVAQELQGLADGVDAVGTTIDAHGAQMVAILAKGAPAIPPEPVPEPTPVP